MSPAEQNRLAKAWLPNTNAQSEVMIRAKVALMESIGMTEPDAAAIIVAIRAGIIPEVTINIPAAPARAMQVAA